MLQPESLPSDPSLMSCPWNSEGRGTPLVKEGNITGCDRTEALNQPLVLGQI